MGFNSAFKVLIFEFALFQISRISRNIINPYPANVENKVSS